MPLKQQGQVEDFHYKFGSTIGDYTNPKIVDRVLSHSLIQEEVDELLDALQEGDIVKVADALGDILYVTLGAAVRMGITMEPVFFAIHESNMTKEGGGERSDGKILKGPDYQPPDIKGAMVEGIKAARELRSKGIRSTTGQHAVVQLGIAHHTQDLFLIAEKLARTEGKSLDDVIYRQFSRLEKDSMKELRPDLNPDTREQIPAS